MSVIAGFIEISPGMFADPRYSDSLKKAGLDSIQNIFAFAGGESLAKAELTAHRERTKIFFEDQNFYAYLKRYENTPPMIQIRNWFERRKRVSMAECDIFCADELNKAGINTPEVIAFGAVRKGIFEKRSFILTKEISNAQSLEKKLPDCFSEPAEPDTAKQRAEFINRLADFIKAFHRTGFRHRDLYLCHIFMTEAGDLYLIDLHRCFRPAVLSCRFRIKDTAQLYYSAPGDIVSRADRLRFYKRYAGVKKLNFKDSFFISRVKARARRMAGHDIKHGREVPFAK